MPEFGNEIAASVITSFGNAARSEVPYRYWIVDDCLPVETVEQILSLPFAAADIAGVSGKRELHNHSRRYFDVESRATHASVEAVASAFQGAHVTSAIETMFGAKLHGTYLRIELCQDMDGFWLEPHTDIGVKTFTFLLYLSKEAEHADLGTDIYDHEKRWAARSPYRSNLGMIFVPSNNTYHGFERRPISGVRKLLVINYVTNDWRAREQLAYPDAPVMSLAVAA